MRCANPNCQTDSAEGSRFCSEHRDALRRVAGDVELDREAFKSHWRERPPKLCAAFGCRSPAAVRESYCAHHLSLLERGIELRGK